MEAGDGVALSKPWKAVAEPPPVGPWLAIAFEHEGRQHSIFGAYRNDIYGQGPPRFVGQQLDELEPAVRVTHYCRLSELIDKVQSDKLLETSQVLPYWSARNEEAVLTAERLYLVCAADSREWSFAHWTALDERDQKGRGVPIGQDEDGEWIYPPAFLLRKEGGEFLLPEEVTSFIDLETIKPALPVLRPQEQDHDELVMV